MGHEARGRERRAGRAAFNETAGPSRARSAGERGFAASRRIPTQFRPPAASCGRGQRLTGSPRVAKGRARASMPATRLFEELPEVVEGGCRGDGVEDPLKPGLVLNGVDLGQETERLFAELHSPGPEQQAAGLLYFGAGLFKESNDGSCALEGGGRPCGARPPASGIVGYSQ